MKFAAALILAAFTLRADSPDANEIMRRVAANQGRAQAARNAYVYDQDVFVRVKRTNGKVAREETRKYVVAPTDQGAQRKIVSVEGRVLDGRKEVTYSQPGFRAKDRDIDGALVDSFAREIMWRENAIGPVAFPFPLAAEQQSKYSFKLEGEEHYHDFDVYRISFRQTSDKDGPAGWEGEALIERNEYQPVLVTSRWDAKIPAAVRFGLGTDVKQVGAKITYRRFAENVWFPVSLGGEMKLRVLFLYGRTLGFSSTAAGFRKAEVRSSIQFEQP